MHVGLTQIPFDATVSFHTSTVLSDEEPLVMAFRPDADSTLQEVRAQVPWMSTQLVSPGEPMQIVLSPDAEVEAFVVRRNDGWMLFVQMPVVLELLDLPKRSSQVS
jgi:hypothetical protein